MPSRLSAAFPALWAWAVLSAAVFVGGSYVVSMGGAAWPSPGLHAFGSFFKILLMALAAVLTLAAAAEAGRRLDDACGGRLAGPAASPPERWAARTAAGAAALAFLGYAVAWLGGAQPWVFRAAGAGGAALCAARLWRGRVSSFRPDMRPFAGLAVAALFAFLPETFGDSLHYVLAGPDLTLRLGRWSVVEGINSFGHPGLARAWHLWALAWGDDRAVKLANVGLCALWAASVQGWTARRWGASAGRWAATVLCLQPTLALYAGAATAEPLAGLLLWSGLARLLDAAENPPSRARELAAAWVFLGAAAAAKPVALAAGPAFLLLTWRAGLPARARTWLPLFAAAALPLLPWAAENLWRFGNPFHPYFPQWSAGLSGTERAMLAGMLEDQRGGEGFFVRLLTPWSAAVTGVREGRVSFIGPLWLMLLPALAVFRAARERKGTWLRLAAAGALCALCFLATTDRLRFAVVLAGPWAAAAGVLAASGGKALRAAAGGALLFQAAALLFVFHRFHDGAGLLLGRETAAQYVRRPHAVFPAPPTAAYDWLAANADPRADKVWLVGEFRAARCPIASVAHTLYDAPLYARWIEDRLLPAAWVEDLRRRGVTHVLVNEAGLALHVSPVFAGAAGRAVLAELTGRLRRVYGGDGVSVYRVDP